MSGDSPNRVAVAETAIQIEDDRFWPYAAVDPAPNYILHVPLYSRRTTAITEMIHAKLDENHDIVGVSFHVEDASWHEMALNRHGPNFSTKSIEVGTSSKISINR